MNRLFIILLTIFLSNFCFCQNKIIVAEGTFKIPAFKDETFYFGFASGDKLIFNFNEANNKELKSVEIIEYPSTSKFKAYKSSDIKDKTIEISNQSIYKFHFTNSSIGSRICKYKIERIPESDDTKSFNTTVYWDTKTDTTYTYQNEKYLVKNEYITQKIIPTEEFYINSTFNSTFKIGKSRVIVPFTLPANTVEWYYQFSAFRDKAKTAKARTLFNLAAQLSKLIEKTGTLSIGIDMLTVPPGGNNCDIYLMDNNNIKLFEAKKNFKPIKDGSRENLVSAIIKMPAGANQKYFIGIKNPSTLWGINVLIEVVAIVQQEVWGERNIKIPQLKISKGPYLKN